MPYKSDKEIKEEFDRIYQSSGEKQIGYSMVRGHTAAGVDLKKYILSLRHADLDAIVEYLESKMIKEGNPVDGYQIKQDSGLAQNKVLSDISAYIKSLKEKNAS